MHVGYMYSYFPSKLYLFCILHLQFERIIFADYVHVLLCISMHIACHVDAMYSETELTFNTLRKPFENFR